MKRLLSPKVSLLACVLLAASLSFAIDQAALIEQDLNSHVLPKLRSANADPNRPISTCALTGSVPKGHRIRGNCPLNFVLSLSEENFILVQGSTSLVRLSVTLVSGVSVPVNLSAQGMPAGTEILFAPASAKPSFSSTMTIGMSAGTPPGQFNLTILAAGGGLERSASLSLLVVPIVHEIAVVSALVQVTAAVGSIVRINATIAALWSQIGPCPSWRRKRPWRIG